MGKFNEQSVVTFLINSSFIYIIILIIMSSLLIESIASAISGVIGKLLCYPLDTVKALFYVILLYS